MLVAVVVSVEWVGNCKSCKPSPKFVYTLLRFEDQNTSNVPIQNRDCINSSPHDFVTLRAHTGHGYFVVGPGFGCTSPESRMRCHDREESEGRCGFDE